MSSRLRKVAAMLLILVLCITQNAGTVLAAENMGGIAEEAEDTASLAEEAETSEDASVPDHDISTALEVIPEASDSISQTPEISREDSIENTENNTEDAEGVKDLAVITAAEDTENTGEPSSETEKVEPTADSEYDYDKIKTCLSVDGVRIVSGNYTANITVNYTIKSEPVDPYERIVMLFKEGTGDVASSNGIVSRDSLGSTNSGWQRLGFGNYNKGGVGDKKSSTRIFGGPWVINGALAKGLTPGQTYTFYITLEKTSVEGGIVIISDKYSFTFNSTGKITTTEIVKKSLKVNGDGVQVEITNPKNEIPAGFYFDVPGKTEFSTEELENDENNGFLVEATEEGENTYGVPFPEEDATKKDLGDRTHLYLIAYTGEANNPTLAAVDLGEVTGSGYDRNVSEDGISIGFKPDVSAIKAIVSYNYVEGKGMPEPDKIAIRIIDTESKRYNTYYNTDERDEWIWNEEFSGGLNWKKNGDVYEAELLIPSFGVISSDDDDGWISANKAYKLRGIAGSLVEIVPEDEEYESYIEPVFTSQTEIMDVTSGADKNISASEFDESFREFLKNDYSIFENENNVSQGALYKLRSILADAISLNSLKGIKYLKNLKEVEINNSQLSNIDELAECGSVFRLALEENKLTRLPNLSGLQNLRSLNLDWNWLPDSEITAGKLPASLEYTDINDDDEPVTVSLEDKAKEIKSTQHRDSDFVYSASYTPGEEAQYSFSLTVGDHKLKSFNLDEYYKNGSLAFYILEVGTVENKGTDQVSREKTGIFTYKIMRDIESDEGIRALLKELKEEYELDNIYLENDASDYSFHIDSVAGVTSPGTKSINLRLYKIIIKQNGKGKTQNLIWEKTDQITWQKGSVSSVQVSPATLELNLGKTSKLNAAVVTEPAGMESLGGVTWSSKDESIASVDKEGNVTGKGVGQTVITATSISDPAKKGSCTVTVKEILPTALSIKTSEGRDTTFVGQTLTLVPVFTPADSTADPSKVTYEAADKEILSVSGATVKGLKEGSTSVKGSYTVSGESVITGELTISVRRSSDSDKSFYKVEFLSENGTVLHSASVLEGLRVTQPSVTPEKDGYMFIGWGSGDSVFDFSTPIYADLKLTALFRQKKVEVTDNSGSGMDAVAPSELTTENNKIKGSIYLVKGQTYTTENPGKGWHTGNKSVAKVDKTNGKITAAGKGNTQVYNESHEYTVYVVEPEIDVEKVNGKEANVDPKKVSILVGQTALFELKLEGVDNNADKYPVTWYSSNTDVLRVNDGLVTGIAKGSANVSAFVGGKEYKGKVKVTDTIKAPGKIEGSSAEIEINAMKPLQLSFASFKTFGSKWEAAEGYSALNVVSTDKKGIPTAWMNDTVKITNKGKITGIGENTTVIKGTDRNGSTVTLTVNVRLINSKSVAFIRKGKSETLKYYGVSNKKAEWSSSAKDKVSVDNDKKKGRIKGEAFGSSEISCSVNDANNLVFETLVYCQEPQLEADSEGKLKLDAKGLTGTLTLDAGEVYKIETSGLAKTPSFKSSNKNAAFVDENGLIYARKSGKNANITAKINGTTLKIKVKVK